MTNTSSASVGGLLFGDFGLLPDATISDNEYADVFFVRVFNDLPLSNTSSCGFLVFCEDHACFVYI